MARLVLMCGTSFSGKSTVAQAIAPALQAVIVSLDEINERRGLWGGDGIPLEEWVRTNALASDEVRAHLAARRNVVLDDTSSLRLLRDAWRTLADECGAEFTLVYLDVDHETIRRRRADNRISVGRRDVADVVLDQHLADFETPEPGEAAVRVKSATELPAWLKP